MNNATTSPTFASLVQEFFTDYMVQQRALSPRTVACYRDSFSLLLGFAQQRLGKAPTTLQLADLTQTFLARSVPLWKDTARDVRAWLRLNEQLTADSPLLPTREGHVMTRERCTTPAVGNTCCDRPTSRTCQAICVSPLYSTHHGHAYASSGRRHQRNSSAAQSRKPIDHAHVRGGRSRNEGARARATRSTRPEVRPISAVGRTASILAGAVIM